MIVEFIGCTGSGKTTLIRGVKQKLSLTGRGKTAAELIAGRVGLQKVKNATFENLIQELVCFPFFIRSLPRHHGYFSYTIRLFSRNAGLSLATLNNLRSLERKIGTYELLRRADKKEIYLVDEGPILAAHMFAYNGASYTPEELERFASLSPLSDLIVYVRAPIDMLTRRTLQRPDPPREIHANSGVSPEGTVRKAVALFDQLVKAENIQSRLLVVENLDHAEEGGNQAVDCIYEAIQSRFAHSLSS